MVLVIAGAFFLMIDSAVELLMERTWAQGGAAVIGFVVFVAIGVSRHPEAYKVRRFGAAVAGAFVVSLLITAVMRVLHQRG